MERPLVLDCERHIVLTLDGEVDIAAADAVRAALSAIVDDGTDRSLVIDLRDVTFLDSSGIGAILSAYRRLKLQQRSMALADPQPIVSRVLDITNVERLLRVTETVSEAVDHCTAGHARTRRPVLR